MTPLNEPGLSSQLVRELRELGQHKQNKAKEAAPEGERGTYGALILESRAVREQQERQRREQERMAREKHLREMYEHRDTYWHQIDMAVAKGNSTGYEEAVKLLVELREAANHFQASNEFQQCYRAWVQNLGRHPSLIKRLQEKNFLV